ALKARDAAGAVIYIGSFSKTVFPGLRLGYMVAEPQVIREARALRSLVLRHPPGVLQRTLAYYLSLGHYDAQMTRMRAAYAQRRAAVAQAIAAHGLTPAAETDRGGSSFWMLLPEGAVSARVAADLRGLGVLIEPGEPFFTTPTDGAGFYRLAYSSIPVERIPDGIARIAAVLARGC
ncbi:MAG TPA: aminotransferase class I/II-fold pyridoxal phosphate-dependent enzyme, partial [Paenirhodobacter sp.]